jgi:tetratricopeptide (TPR) repeat protein
MGRQLLQKTCCRCVRFLLAVWLLAAPALAADVNDRLLRDARDGRLEDFDFVTAALIAGGADDECELSGWLDRHAQRRDQLLDSIPTAPAIEQLQAIHDALHDQILKGNYEVAASDLRMALSRGDYNCLSSLAIYLDLCQAADLPLEIWLTRGHVFLRGVADGQAVVIEPGTPEWEAGRTAWKASITARRHRARQLTPVELLGKFYYNRGVELLKTSQFADGIKLLETSLELDPADRDARANLLAGLNNWAVEQLRARRYDQAAALIEQGLLLDPSFAPLVANQQLVRARLSE